jgi:G3E family GTPase
LVLERRRCLTGLIFFTSRLYFAKSCNFAESYDNPFHRILTTNHGKRIAVIQNEFGEDLGLGSTVAAEGSGAEVFEECYEMNNGCICCSVRDELVNTLERIMRRRDKFDYVVVETTGMANPGPIASIFWLDSELESDLFLDAIITVVDAKHIALQLDPGNGAAEEAEMQIAFADRIILNKVDLVTEQELDEVQLIFRGG